MIRFLQSVVFITALLVAAFQASALERFEIVTTSELKQMLDLRQAGQMDFLLVNVLDELIYNHTSIPGSINIPWSRVGENVDNLGPDKKKLIIVY